ncbi:hypothetical protein FFJ24_021600 [Pedobacter sp. KBS0701]|uniref:hypothetical protein n=1 Tax=Pedobacter sp. KBS0701 TaxID=2578106 RepID=UPI00110D5F68|nr:hypothetical protein [Pedobacter sp. KBS0701]QDW27281.1 hypothetical protein FFJ24_021600 [Pedobacter sp. KBS0701]
MNESNLEYLKKSLDYLGFGTKLNDVLETAIRREIPKFSVGISTAFEPSVRQEPDLGKKDAVHFTLDFNRAKDSDTYFLNDYTAVLNTHNGIERHQEFNLERDNRITASQAYKLLLGASLQKEVFKRGETEGAPAEKTDVWFKLNLDVIDSYGRHPVSKIHPSYGFDLEQAVNKYPIVWQKENDRATLLENLKKGLFTKVAMEVNGDTMLAVVTANPQMKNLDVYDYKMNPIKSDRIFAGKEFPQRVELSGEHGQSTSGQTNVGAPEAVAQDQNTEHTRSRGR